MTRARTNAAAAGAVALGALTVSALALARTPPEPASGWPTTPPTLRATYLRGAGVLRAPVAYIRVWTDRRAHESLSDVASGSVYSETTERKLAEVLGEAQRLWIQIDFVRELTLRDWDAYAPPSATDSPSRSLALRRGGAFRAGDTLRYVLTEDGAQTTLLRQGELALMVRSQTASERSRVLERYVGVGSDIRTPLLRSFFHDGQSYP